MPHPDHGPLGVPAVQCGPAGSNQAWLMLVRWPGTSVPVAAAAVPLQSAGRQSGNRARHPAELADWRELAVLAHRPAEQLLRVGVDRV